MQRWRNEPIDRFYFSTMKAILVAFNPIDKPRRKKQNKKYCRLLNIWFLAFFTTESIDGIDVVKSTSAFVQVDYLINDAEPIFFYDF